MGSFPLPLFVLSVFGSVALVVGLAVAWGKLRQGGREDDRWAEAALELGPGTLEVLAWDTRIWRPWGHSNAVASFVVRARCEGFEWLEPVVLPFQELSPLGVRALVGRLAGRPVAYVHCYGRLRPEGRFVAGGDAAPLVVSDLEHSGTPPRDVRARLEALARGEARGA